jgi:uncharacterized protein (DUF58 family)
MPTRPLPPAASWPNPAAFVRQRFRGWWQARLQRTDTLLLAQRNVYILPTRAGFVYAATLLVLLVASINYQLNLGYLLTFILAGSGLVPMHVTHATLRGLTLHLRPLAPVHAGDAARLDVVLASPDKARWGIGVGLEAAGDDTLAWTDVPAGGEAVVRVGHAPTRRGLHELPLLRVETRFPLGLFRAWAVWRPASRQLVYPAPERPPAPFPSTGAQPGETAPASRSAADGAEFDGVRGYRRGDPLKHVVWKKAATALATGGELISREHAGSASARLHLAWHACAGMDAEARLSRLAGWLLAAHRAGLPYSLALPGVELPPGDGDAQRRAGLEALALWR